MIDYQDKITPLVNEEYRRFESSNFPSLYLGTGAALLYTLFHFQKTKSKVHLLKLKSLLTKGLNNIQYVMKDTSFFIGPLGLLWVNFLIRDNTNKNFLSNEVINNILDQYFDYQEKALPKDKAVLDYIYGVTGWFIIYPYLGTKHQKRLRDIFEQQLKSMDNFSIYSQKQIDGAYFYKKNQQYLGFAHGIASILYILNEYYGITSDHPYRDLKNIMTKAILENVKSKSLLARSIGSDDYIRQDWCHGNLGIMMSIPGLQKDILENYFSNKVAEKSYGICHGMGQKILLEKISHYLTGTQLEFEEIEYTDLEIHPAPAYFLQSHMSAQMAYEFDIERDHLFSWWRLCYPVNRTTLS